MGEAKRRRAAGALTPKKAVNSPVYQANPTAHEELEAYLRFSLEDMKETILAAKELRDDGRANDIRVDVLAAAETAKGAIEIALNTWRGEGRLAPVLKALDLIATHEDLQIEISIAHARYIGQPEESIVEEYEARKKLSADTIADMRELAEALYCESPT